MIQELVYTSAPKGLKPGSVGFCTVASTPGMAPNLAKFLAVQSRYRHLIPPGSPGAESNPVNYSHVKSRIGGKDFYVLSRVADAGLDYSNRSNMLAHHFAIDNVMSLGCGPASILKKEEQFFCEWTKEPTKLDPRKLLGISSQPKTCHQWKSVTGDAGWAGNVIEAFTKKTLVYIVIAPSIPALDLVNEMLSLIPVEQQWDFTFSTFYTKGSGDVDCGIRFIMEGSAEVALARRSRANLVLDLTKPLGQSQSKFADNARSGKLLFEKKPTLVSSESKEIDSVKRVHEPSADLPLADQSNGLEIDDAPPELPSTQLQQKTHLAPPTLKGGYKPKLPKSEIVVTERGSKLGPVVFAASLLFLLIGLGAAFPFVFRSAEVAAGGSGKKAVTEKKEDNGAGEKEKTKPDAEVAQTQNESEKDNSNSAPDDTSGNAKPVPDEMNDNEDENNQPSDNAPSTPPKASGQTGQGNNDKNSNSTKRDEAPELIFTPSKRTQKLVHNAEQAIGDVTITPDIDLDTIFDNLEMKLSGDGFEITVDQSGQKFEIKSKDVPDSALGFFTLREKTSVRNFEVKYEYNPRFFGGPHEPLYEKLNSSVLAISFFGKERGDIDLGALEPSVKVIKIKLPIKKGFKSKSLWPGEGSEFKFISTDANDQKHAIHVGDGSTGKCRLTFEIEYKKENKNGKPPVLEYELKRIKFGDEEFGLSPDGKKPGRKDTGTPIPDGIINRFLNEQINERRMNLEDRIKKNKSKKQDDPKIKARLEGELSDLMNFESQLKMDIKIIGEKDVLKVFSDEENMIYEIHVSYILEEFTLINKKRGRAATVNVDPCK